MFEFKSVAVSSSRSVTRTLRLDEDVEAGIVEMAEREQFSFNLLANRALRKLVEWEDKAGKFGFIQVPTSIVEKVFNILSDEEARELGREAGTNTLPEMVLFWFKNRGPRVSAFYAELLGSLFKPMGARVETHETDGQVVATIVRPMLSASGETRAGPLVPSLAGAKNGRGYKR
jgi:hypothetical protein